MDIKLVALDMDGTLLRKDLQIPDRTKEAIRVARQKGIKVALVTGRMFQNAAPYARELELFDVPMITYNGALMKEFPSGRTIFHDPIPLETCKALLAFCEAHAYHAHAYVNDELYVADMGPKTQEYLAIARVKAHPVGSLFLWLSEPSTKMLIVDDPVRAMRIQAEISELLGPAVHAAPSVPGFLEVVNGRVSKATALAELAASLGIDRSEVMAVGDGMNDLPMLKWAGISFAMGHAPEALKQAATHVLQAGPGEGVVEAFARAGLLEL